MRRVSEAPITELLKQRPQGGGQWRDRSAPLPLRPQAVDPRIGSVCAPAGGKAGSGLAELRAALGLDCILTAILYVFTAMGLTYQKRRFALLNRTCQTLRGGAAGGSGGKAASIPPSVISE